MLILIFLPLLISIMLITVGLAFSGNEARRLRLPDEKDQLKGISFIAKAFPFSKKLLEKFKIYSGIGKKLDLAHLNILPEEFFSMKLASTLLFCILGYLIAKFAVHNFEVVIIMVSFMLGYILPDIWLRKKINQRKYLIVRSLPETVDLLGLCVEAGLDFTMAVKWIITKTTPNAMVEELGVVLEEIKWGKPRTEALKDMSRKLDISEVRSFVHTLVQAERLGTPVVEAFKILSEDSRQQRFHRGERMALKAPIKILIPLVLCILPVIGIIVGGPIFLNFMQGKLF